MMVGGSLSPYPPGWCAHREKAPMLCISFLKELFMGECCCGLGGHGCWAASGGRKIGMGQSTLLPSLDSFSVFLSLASPERSMEG